MSMSDDNKEAIESSVIVGVAFGLFFGLLTSISETATSSPWAVGLVFGLSGFALGLLTTWDFDVVEDEEE